MITEKLWREVLKCNKKERTFRKSVVKKGYFLFGFIPLYIKTVKVEYF
jgi:hypothetical protein